MNPPDGTITVGTSCSEETVDHPQQQVSAKRTVKEREPPEVVEKIVNTVIAQKEVFFCDLTDPDDKIVDLVIFEDIYEDLIDQEITKVSQ